MKYAVLHLPSYKTVLLAISQFNILEHVIDYTMLMAIVLLMANIFRHIPYTLLKQFVFILWLFTIFLLALFLFVRKHVRIFLIV